MTETANKKHANRIERLGFCAPQDRPKAMRWFEILTLFYMGYAALFLLRFISLFGEYHTFNFYSIALAVLLLMGFLVFLVSRRGSIIAYWIMVALLIQPTVKMLRSVNEFSWNGFLTAQPLDVWPSTVITFVAFLFLIQPQNLAWSKARCAERKAQKNLE